MKLTPRLRTTLVLAGCLPCFLSAANGQMLGPPAAAPINRPQVLRLLREAAAQGHADALAMLVSLEGRAAGASMSARRPMFSSPMEGSFSDPSAIKPPGYHCHMLRPGVSWCHARSVDDGN